MSRFRWTFHNVIAHPLSEALYLLGFARALRWVHNASVPGEEGS